MYGYPNLNIARHEKIKKPNYKDIKTNKTLFKCILNYKNITSLLRSSIKMKIMWDDLIKQFAKYE